MAASWSSNATPQWAPTTKPYDTTWFAEPKLFGEASGYNYAAIYKYLGQYYQMSRLLESDKIDDETLSKCDVLVIKIPTTRYTKDEAEAVVRFVQQGGGLLLIGDHTNYEGSATTMNDITRPMGFIFRDDLLFGFGESPYDEHYAPPPLPHPILQHVPPWDFAVSCSIDPGHSRGRAVIAPTGLWSMGPEYHHENYHPFPQHCPEMRYGPFVQVWAAWYGQGRAVAFTDSTIFSNFCTFQPGKAELMLGMVEWLNHGNPPLDPRPWLLLLGLLPLAAGLWMRCSPHTSVLGEGQGVRAARLRVRTRGVCRSLILTLPRRMSAHGVCRRHWLVLLAAGGCGWVAASLGVTALHRWALPTPECVRPLPRVVIDRTISTVPLAKGLYTQGNNEGYGMLEAWIPRLGCYTVPQRGTGGFLGRRPGGHLPQPVGYARSFASELTEYVAQGGKLLVIDSPENTGSRANDLLWPFGLSIHHDRAWKGKLSTTAKVPTVDIASANQVTGGQPVGKLDQLPVAAVAKYGKGSVMAVGFGSLWNDKRMGENWMLEPNATVKARYDLLFALLRSLLEDRPLPKFPPPPPPKKPQAELPLKESGTGRVVTIRETQAARSLVRPGRLSLS